MCATNTWHNLSHTRVHLFGITRVKRLLYPLIVSTRCTRVLASTPPPSRRLASLTLLVCSKTGTLAASFQSCLCHQRYLLRRPRTPNPRRPRGPRVSLSLLPSPPSPSQCALTLPVPPPLPRRWSTLPSRSAALPSPSPRQCRGPRTDSPETMSSRSDGPPSRSASPAFRLQCNKATPCLSTPTTGPACTARLQTCTATKTLPASAAFTFMSGSLSKTSSHLNGPSCKAFPGPPYCFPSTAGFGRQQWPL